MNLHTGRDSDIKYNHIPVLLDYLAWDTGGNSVFFLSVCTSVLDMEPADREESSYLGFT